MKLGVALAGLLGLLLATGLMAYQGFDVVARSVLGAGWGLVLVPVLHLPPMVLTALAWRSLLAPEGRQPVLRFVWIRWLRESVNNLLPVAQIGGELVGARLLALRGLSARAAGASVMVDFTLEAVSQFPFTMAGVVLLLAGGPVEGARAWLAVGAVVVGLAPAGLVIAQRWGLLRVVDRLIAKVAEKMPSPGFSSTIGFHDAVHRIYRDHRAIAVAGAYHLMSWIVGTGEVWLALTLMGHPISLVDALILESLGQAVRSAAFAVPGALGVQEGGYALLAGLMGLGPEIGLALSLIKRARELALGLPGLLVWQAIEGRRAWLRVAVRGHQRQGEKRS